MDRNRSLLIFFGILTALTALNDFVNLGLTGCFRCNHTDSNESPNRLIDRTNLETSSGNEPFRSTEGSTNSERCQKLPKNKRLFGKKKGSDGSPLAHQTGSEGTDEVVGESSLGGQPSDKHEKRKEKGEKKNPVDSSFVVESDSEPDNWEDDDEEPTSEPAFEHKKDKKKKDKKSSFSNEPNPEWKEAISDEESDEYEKPTPRPKTTKHEDESDETELGELSSLEWNDSSDEDGTKASKPKEIFKKKTPGESSLAYRPKEATQTPRKKPESAGNLLDSETPKYSKKEKGSSTVERLKEKVLPSKKPASQDALDEDMKVQVAVDGRMNRSPHMAKKFKEEVKKRSFKKGLSNSFIITGESCAKGLGNVYKKYLPKGELIYEVCFNDSTATAIYTTHNSKPAVEKTKTDRKEMDTKWRSTYLLSLWNIDLYYTKRSQKAEYDRIFGDDQKYVEIEGSNWYAHAHLTPHGDFVDEEEQLATYEHHNCVPGKQSVNNGNWKKVENFGRGLCKDYNTYILVYTGVHEHLKLKNLKTGRKTEAWLNEERKHIAVPKFHWKLYINSANNDSIAFFTSNDTEMDESGVKEVQKMCSDKLIRFNCAFIGRKSNTRKKL